MSRLFISIREEWPILALIAVGFIAWSMFSAGLGLFETVNATVLSLFWFVVVVGAVRASILPFQYYRHRRAVTRFLASERDLAERLAKGDAVARVQASMAVKDPSDTPWWRW